MALPPSQNTSAPDFLAYKDAPVPDPQVQTNLSGFDGTSTSLSAATLAPTTPINIPPSQPETAASSFQAELEGLGKATSTTKAKKESSFDDLMSSLTSSSTEGELTNQAYAAEGGVDQTEADLKDINAQLLGEQEGLRRTIEGIQDNAEGLTRSGVRGKVDEARRKSLRTQADLAVIQMAKQGRYDSAKAIADRAVNAYLEKQKQRNELLQFAYTENKDAFSKAEQREFETKQKERERALDREDTRLKEISDLSLDALQNGAPAAIAAQMRAAKSVEDAMKIGGQYVGKYDRAFKQMQIANIQSQMNERNNPGTKPLTVDQYKALGYGQRTLQAGIVIDKIGEQFTGAGSQLGWVPNFLRSDERQQYEQAQRNFINAVLRRESGASIAPTEFESASLQYFPQRGDKPDTLVQKKQNRDLVIQSLLREGGTDTTPQDASLADPLGLGVGATANPLNL